MAIGYGIAAPKPAKSRKQLKARKDREDAKELRSFRDAVWMREAHKLWNDHKNWVSLDVAACQHCGHLIARGKTRRLTGEVHHRIGRRNPATRYDPDNGVLLCNRFVNDCHRKAQRKEIQV